MFNIQKSDNRVLQLHLAIFTFLQSLKKFSLNTVLVVYSWSNIWAKNTATSSDARLSFTFLPADKEKQAHPFTASIKNTVCETLIKIECHDLPI